MFRSKIMWLRYAKEEEVRETVEYREINWGFGTTREISRESERVNVKRFDIAPCLEQL